MKFNLSLLAAFLLINFCCKKDSVKSVITIEGFNVIDYSGNPLKHVGPPDTDWQFVSTLSSQELALFNFETSLSDDNTLISSSIEPPIFYPIPSANSQGFFCSSPDSVILKIVIVDADLGVLKQNAFKIKGDHFSLIDISDTTIFKDKTAYRVYFSFSAKNETNAKFGYGDIKICEDAWINNSDPFACF